MDDLISVIVPVYNAENTIEKTVDSLQQQEYTSIEIILVNDGSTDSSKEICENLQKRITGLAVYSIKNSGPSAARQYGLDRAKGKYVVFCDADDTMEKTMISTLSRFMHEMKCQLSVCSFDNGATNKVASVDGDIEAWNQI